MLIDEKPNTTITDIGSNDITKSNYQTINADELVKGIVNIRLKCKYYGVGQKANSSIITRSNSDLNKVIKQVNLYLRSLCKTYGFTFICNANSDRNRLWRDGIDFTNEGTAKDSDETCTIHTISDNIEIMIGNKVNGIIEKNI